MTFTVKVLKFHDTQNAQTLQKYDDRNIYAIMKTMCPPGYHDNGFVATHAPGHMLFGYTLLVPMHELLQSHCGDNREATLVS